MRWTRSWRADPRGKRIADRHYNRQNSNSPQFVPPGRSLVLLADTERALWVSSWPYAEHVLHDWAGAWVNTTFRNEGAGLSSELIREAVAATRAEWGEAPELGMVTMVDPGEVRSTNPGYCYLMAGFERVGITKDRGLLVLQMLPQVMPAAVSPSEPTVSRDTIRRAAAGQGELLG